VAVATPWIVLGGLLTIVLKVPGHERPVEALIDNIEILILGAFFTTGMIGGFFSKALRDYGQTLLVSGFEAATKIPTAGLRAPKDVLFFSDLAYDLKQSALFGEATFNVTDKLDVTADSWTQFANLLFVSINHCFR
jgi:hypothetical protein